MHLGEKGDHNHVTEPLMCYEGFEEEFEGSKR